MQHKENHVKETMSVHDRMQIGMKSVELRKQGKFEEAERVFKQIPMSPFLAKWAKKRMGADFLIKYGWNLADANEVYGHDWLNK
jgi:hypothetical protein